ncbi:MAG: hypothetical protein ABI685_05570 [Ferruginibacter sp.]
MENSIDILNELKALSPTLAAIEKVNVFTVPAGYFEHLATGILMGVEDEIGAGSNVSTVSSLTDVPAGYFDTLATSILAKIKAAGNEDAITETGALSPQLFSIKNESTFEVPQGYFDSLADSILAKIKTADSEDAAAEIRALSPMLYSIQNENIFEVPQDYFADLSNDILNKVKPQPKVVTMQRRSNNFFKYAVAAAFTGLMALSVFKFTGKTHEKTVLPDYVTAGLQVQDVDQELAKISNADIVKYLEAEGTDVKAAIVANSVDENELPTQEDYLLDDKALDKYLNSINIDDLKN